MKSILASKTMSHWILWYARHLTRVAVIELAHLRVPRALVDSVGAHNPRNQNYLLLRFVGQGSRCIIAVQAALKVAVHHIKQQIWTNRFTIHQSAADQMDKDTLVDLYKYHPWKSSTLQQ